MSIMSIGEIMTKKLEKINMSASAQEAAKAMTEGNVSSLVVTDMNDKAIGIVTEQNLVRRVVANDESSGKVNIQKIMFSPPVTIDANSSVEVAADIMIENKVKHLLVVENEDLNKPLGIITTNDFVGYLKRTPNEPEHDDKKLHSIPTRTDTPSNQ
jgi:signal-transduction protein with cAMP-binding, CBS, and nucleotidyltransferase domain